MSYIDANNIEEVKFMGSRKEFSLFLFVILLIFGVIPALIYVIYYLAKNNDILMYAIKFKDGTIKYQEFDKDDVNLKEIKDIEAKQLFNKNN